MRTQKEFAAALHDARTQYVDQLSDELRGLSAKALRAALVIQAETLTPSRAVVARISS